MESAKDVGHLPDYAVVIPMRELEGNPLIDELMRSLSGQSHRPREIHLVIGDERQGRAINHGFKSSRCPLVGTLDDDSFIDDPELFEKILREMARDDRIGMAGAACEIPTWATPFQQRAMREISRRQFPRQSETVDSDMVQHPCLMMPREFFEAIGGEDEELVRGLDPVLRKKVRDAGKRVVIVADTWVYHLLPKTFKGLLRMYYRNGSGSGFAQRHFGHKVLELTDGYDAGKFVERRPLVYRAIRRLGSVVSAALGGQWIRLSTDIAYAAGVLKERWMPGSPAMARKVVKVDLEQRDWYGLPVWIHRMTLE